ncbi:MAG: hypothetical protein ACW97O_13225 [Candidatus Thorarchaeota archaeon]|jgi:hypothetical protein
MAVIVREKVKGESPHRPEPVRANKGHRLHISTNIRVKKGAKQWDAST